MYPSKKREELDYILEVIEAVLRGYSLSRIAMYMNTNYVSVKKITKKLVDRGFLESREEPGCKRQVLSVTDKGLQLRRLLSELQYKLYTNGGSAVSQQIDLEEVKEKGQRAKEIILSKKRRTRVEIYFLILYHCADAPRSISSIANACFLNIEKAKEYISELQSANMISSITVDGHLRYKTTERGLQYLTIFLKIFELVYE